MADGKGRQGAFGLLRIVIGFALIAAFALIGNYVHSHSTFFRQVDPDSVVDLNAVIQSGGEMPVGEFVTLNARWPLGEFAYEQETRNGITSGTDHYYLILLEDRTFMAAKLSNAQEIAAVDGQVSQLAEASSVFEVKGGVALTGKLTKLTNTKIRGYYTETLAELGYSADDPEVRMLVLDTTALNSTRVLIAIGIAAGLAIILFVVFRLRKRAARKAAEDPYHTAEAAITGTGEVE